jgi:hypothetical protein
LADPQGVIEGADFGYPSEQAILASDGISFSKSSMPASQRVDSSGKRRRGLCVAGEGFKELLLDGGPDGTDV